jgi:hypothetical protein
MGPIIGKVAYHAGASGPVTLDKNERVLHIRALGGAGGKLTIDGGDEIPIPANYVFDDSITDGRGEQWVGAVLVFTSTVSYFVKTINPAAL